MSERGVAKAKEDALASGATPRPAGRVRERGRRPTRKGFADVEPVEEAARLRAIAHGRRSHAAYNADVTEAAA
jgi:hypothetical protein